MLRKNLDEAIDHLKKFKFEPKTIIDVGVAYGTKGLYGKYKNVYHLLVEPLKEYEKSCQNIIKKYGGEYILAAASDSIGHVKINVHPDLSGSSLFNESEGPQVDGEPRIVPTKTLDSICQEKKIEGPFLMKIDAQGAELKVLNGAINILNHTEIIVLEAFLFNFYEETPLLADIVLYLKDMDFLVYDIFGAMTRPLDGALSQVDLVFVKKAGEFRKSSHFASPDQRKKMTSKRIKFLNKVFK